ncbi:MAG: strawberry notch C-terminal domain-containing protein, partial [Planctomycetota bacterium]
MAKWSYQHDSERVKKRYEDLIREFGSLPTPEGDLLPGQIGQKGQVSHVDKDTPIEPQTTKPGARPEMEGGLRQLPPVAEAAPEADYPKPKTGLAHDDYTQSAQARQKFQVGPIRPRTQPTEVAELGARGLMGGFALAPGAAGGTMEIAGKVAQAAGPFQYGMGGVGTAGVALEKAGEYVSEKGREAQEFWAPPPEVMKSIEEDPSVLLSAKWWAYHGGQLVGTMLPFMVGGVYGGMLGGTAGAVGGAAGLETLFELGLVYTEAKEAGATDEQAAKGAALVAAVNAAITPIPAELIFDKSVGRKVKNVVLRWAIGGGAEAGQEIAQEKASVAASRMYAPEPGMRGYQEFRPVTAGVLGGVGGAGASAVLDIAGGRPGETGAPAADAPFIDGVLRGTNPDTTIRDMAYRPGLEQTFAVWAAHAENGLTILVDVSHDTQVDPQIRAAAKEAILMVQAARGQETPAPVVPPPGEPQQGAGAPPPTETPVEPTPSPPEPGPTLPPVEPGPPEPTPTPPEPTEGAPGPPVEPAVEYVDMPEFDTVPAGRQDSALEAIYEAGIRDWQFLEGRMRVRPDEADAIREVIEEFQERRTRERPGEPGLRLEAVTPEVAATLNEAFTALRDPQGAHMLPTFDYVEEKIGPETMYGLFEEGLIRRVPDQPGSVEPTPVLAEHLERLAGAVPGPEMAVDLPEFVDLISVADDGAVTVRLLDSWLKSHQGHAETDAVLTERQHWDNVSETIDFELSRLKKKEAKKIDVSGMELLAGFDAVPEAARGRAVGYLNKQGIKTVFQDGKAYLSNPMQARKAAEVLEDFLMDLAIDEGVEPTEPKEPPSPVEAPPPEVDQERKDADADIDDFIDSLGEEGPTFAGEMVGEEAPKRVVLPSKILKSMVTRGAAFIEEVAQKQSGEPEVTYRSWEAAMKQRFSEKIGPFLPQVWRRIRRVEHKDTIIPGIGKLTDVMIGSQEDPDGDKERGRPQDPTPTPDEGSPGEVPPTGDPVDSGIRGQGPTGTTRGAPGPGDVSTGGGIPAPGVVAGTPGIGPESIVLRPGKVVRSSDIDVTGLPDRQAQRRLQDFAEVQLSDRFTVAAPDYRRRGNTHPRLFVESKSTGSIEEPSSPLTPQDYLEGLSDDQATQTDKNVAAFVSGHGRVNGHDVGTGKTRMELALIKWIIGEYRRTNGASGAPRIIFSTKNKQVAAQIFDEEAKNVGGMKVRGEPIRWKLNTDLMKSFVAKADLETEAGKKFTPIPSDLDVFVTNNTYHAMTGWRNAMQQWVDESPGPVVLISDESHDFRNFWQGGGPEGRPSQAAIVFNRVSEQILDKNGRVFYFTATPAEKPDHLRMFTGIDEFTNDTFQNYMRAAAGHPPVVVGEPVTEGTTIRDSEMEQLVREWKMRGKWTGVSMWKGGVTYEMHDVPEAETKAIVAKADYVADLARRIWETAKRFGPMGTDFAKTARTIANQYTMYVKRMQSDMRLDPLMGVIDRYIDPQKQVDRLEELFSIEMAPGELEPETAILGIPAPTHPAGPFAEEFAPIGFRGQFATWLRENYADAETYMAKFIERHGEGALNPVLGLYRRSRGGLPRAVRTKIYRANKMVRDGTVPDLEPKSVVVSIVEKGERGGEGAKGEERIGRLDTAIRNITDVDVDGYPIPEAVRAKEALQAEVDEHFVIRNPVRALQEQFGAERVAMITGAEKPAERQQLLAEFQAGKRHILVITSAGAIGLDAHHIHDTGPGNRQRVFVPLDYDWSATMLMQRLGRVDRANQVTSPIIAWLKMPFHAERRFLMAAANKMRSLGVTSRGQTDVATTQNLQSMELNEKVARNVVRTVWARLPDRVKEAFLKGGFRDRNGAIITDPNRIRASGEDFLKDLILMPTELANQLHDMFMEQYESEYADALGRGERLQTERSKGKILRSIPATEELTLHDVETGGVYVWGGDPKGPTYVDKPIPEFRKKVKFVSVEDFNKKAKELQERVGMVSPFLFEHGVLFEKGDAPTIWVKVGTQLPLLTAIPGLENLEWISRHRFSVLSGLVMTSEEGYMRVLRDVLPERDIRRWITVEGKTGIVSGHRIAPGRRDAILDALDVAETGPTLDNFRTYLEAGDRVLLGTKAANGKPFVLHKNAKGQYIIENATLKDKDMLVKWADAQGLDPASMFDETSKSGQQWHVPEPFLEQFVTDFGLEEAEAPPPEDEGRFVGEVAGGGEGGRGGAGRGGGRRPGGPPKPPRRRKQKYPKGRKIIEEFDVDRPNIPGASAVKWPTRKDRARSFFARVNILQPWFLDGANIVRAA